MIDPNIPPFYKGAVIDVDGELCYVDSCEWYDDTDNPTWVIETDISTMDWHQEYKHVSFFLCEDGRWEHFNKPNHKVKITLVEEKE